MGNSTTPGTFGLSTLGSTALSSGLGFLGNLGGSLLGGLFNANQAKINRKFQERMYDKQVQDNINFWKLQQEYNLPSAQLERIRQAGLSGLLMYGEGGLTGNVAGQAPQSGTAPHGAQASASFHTPIDVPNIALLDAQKRNIETDTLLKQRESEYYQSQSKKTDTETENLSFDLAFKKDARELNLRSIELQNNLTESMRFLNDQERYKMVHEISVIDKEFEQISASIRNQQVITDAQVSEINNRIQNENKKLSHVIANLDAQSRAYLAEAYANEVSAYIQKNLFSSEYIKILQGQAGQDLLNAIKQGNEIDIVNGLNALDFMMRPKPGEDLFNWNRTQTYIVQPIFSMLKDGAMAGASIYLAGKAAGGRSKVGKIGFAP